MSQLLDPDTGGGVYNGDMKVFWAIIVVLVAVTAGMFLMRGGGSGSSATPAAGTGAGPEAEASAAAPTDDARDESAGDDRMVRARPEDSLVAAPVDVDDASAPLVVADDSSSEPVDLPDDEGVVAEGDAAAPSPAVDEGLVVDDEPDAPLTLADAGDALNDALDIEASEGDDAESSSGLVDASADIPSEPLQLTPGEHLPDHQPVAMGPLPEDIDLSVPSEQSLERDKEGRLLIAGKYVVSGSGTEADPYEVPWDLILTARDTYRPRLGRKDIPSGLQMLDGQYLRVRGYMLLPLMGSDIRELLLMRNQWDGCCIGVPPTPYDAIEVKLTEVPTTLSRWRVNFGTVTGKFNIDPYERKDWLLSLYTMEDAVVRVTGF